MFIQDSALSKEEKDEVTKRFTDLLRAAPEKIVAKLFNHGMNIAGFMRDNLHTPLPFILATHLDGLCDSIVKVMGLLDDQGRQEVKAMVDAARKKAGIKNPAEEISAMIREALASEGFEVAPDLKEKPESIQ